MLLAHIRETGRCVYDTEFIGELSYYPQLCLIQLLTAEQAFYIVEHTRACGRHARVGDAGRPGHS